MKKIALLVLVGLAMGFGLGCGGGSEDLTKSEANKVQQAIYSSALTFSADAQTVLAQAEAGKADSISVGGKDYTYEITTDGISFEFSATSAEGGSATVTGKGSFAGGSYSYELDVVYSAFTVNGIELDGSLSLSFSGSGSEYSFSMSGTVVTSGSVIGTADFDLTVTTSTDSATVKGSVGGHSIDATVNYDDYSNYY
jgi:hypothetical protein